MLNEIKDEINNHCINEKTKVTALSMIRLFEKIYTIYFTYALFRPGVRIISKHGRDWIDGDRW